MAARNSTKMIRYWHERTQQSQRIALARAQWDQGSIRYAISVWSWRSRRHRVLRSNFNTLWYRHHRRVMRERFVEWYTKRAWNERFARMSTIVERLHGGDVFAHWQSASLTLRVEAMQRARVVKYRYDAVRFWHFYMLRRTTQKAATRFGAEMKARLQQRRLRAIFACWARHRLESSRIRAITEKHARLVQQDYLTAWHECMELARNLRNRDSDFMRILTLRKEQLTWYKWMAAFRVRRLQRRVMERRSREHLHGWIEIMEMKKIGDIKLERMVWKGWMKYVMR